MARVTVEDCLENVDNRFDLVMIASKRARQLAMSGSDPYVAWENDKATVVALREIADGFIDKSILTQKPQMQMELEEAAAEAETGGEDKDKSDSGTAAA